MICGGDLKGLAIGEYFKDCEIEEDDCCDIEFYEPKETEDRGWMSIMRFRIPDLSRQEYHEVH